MKIPGLAIKNYQFVIILVLLGTFLGVTSLRNMSRNEDPNPAFPFYNIVAIYPGTSPEDMEELVVDPLEDAIDQVDDITSMETKIEEGVAVIQVEAAFGLDTDEKFDEILSAVKDQEPNLPELFALDVSKFEPNSRVNIMQLALGSSDKSFAQLTSLAEKLETRLERVKGVDDVDIVANPEEVIKVTIDFERMAAFNIPIQQLIGVLKAQNLNIPAGDLAAGNKSFSIVSSGSFNSLDQISNAVVSQADGAIVKVKDIADVRFDYAEDNWIARYNGKRSILLTVTQKSGNNLIHVGHEINQELADFKQTLTKDVFLTTVFEQAPAVQSRISNFFSNLIQGVLLVGLITIIFLGFRSSVVVMTVIPLSIVIAVAVLDWSGYALQQISIAGLVIALGLLVDNGIVVVENIQRYMKMGHSIQDAAIKGTGEVGLSIISSTVTTVLAFFPLAKLESGAGEFLRTLPLTVIFTLVISLLLALTLTPILASRLFKNKSTKKEGWFERFLEKLIQKAYGPLLKASLKRGWLVMLIGLAFFVGAFALFPAVGVSFFPTADKPLLLVEVNTPRGSSIERTDKAVDYVTKVLSEDDFVSSYTTNTGHGNPMIYYNRPNENYKKYHAQILVNFESWDPERFYPSLEGFRAAFAQYPDAKITFNELKNGPPFEAPIEIKIIGEDLDVLEKYSFELEELIQRTPGTIDIDNPFRVSKTDLKIAINRDKASLYGVSLASIDEVLRANTDGLLIDEISLDQNKYDLMVQSDYRNATISGLRKTFVTNQTGDQIPLSQLATITFKPAVAEILHFNKDRSIAITANVTDPEKTAAITEEIMAGFSAIELPEGYELYVAGEYEGQQDSFGDLGQLLIIALVGIFAVLVLQFRSFKQPLIVFAAIPLAITGSFIALYLTGWSFSFFAFVGFNSLIGIVVNNSIILVDYTNQLMAQGESKIDAIQKAAKTRFKPIVLTTTTTILGLVPLTFQGTNLWSPLGWTIIGGMISSTFLTLLIVPVLYKWLTNPKPVIESTEKIEAQISMTM